MKRNPSLLITTFLIGTTALSLALSAPTLTQRVLASKKAHTVSKTKKKKKKRKNQIQQLQTGQSSRLDPRTAAYRAGNARPRTAAESLGTPAPVLPASTRYPQSSGKAAVAKTASLSTSQSSTVQVALANPVSASSASASSLTPAGKVEKRFGGDVTLTYSASTTVDTASDRSASADLELAPWVALSKNFKMDVYVAGNKDLRGDREWKFANSQIGLSRAPLAVAGEQLKYRPKITIALPTDEDAREIASYRGALSLSNRFLFMPKALPAFSGYYQLSLGRNFYQYETTGLGESNNAWSTGHILLLNVDFAERFYLQVVPRLTTRWTFAGTASTKFDAAQEIGMVLGQWALGIGHTNSDDLYKSNGRESNFSIFDRDTSNYYFTANLAF